MDAGSGVKGAETCSPVLTVYLQSGNYKKDGLTGVD